MTSILMCVEAYSGLIGHSSFMRRNNFASLHERVRSFPLAAPGSSPVSIDAVNHSLDVACVLYPKQVLCLQRSAVLVRMLRSRGIDARMMIGVQKLPFKAHAWVEIDGQVIHDRLASRERFLILEVC